MTTQYYKIGGITVEFPYKAYGPQLAYMSKVVVTLEQSRLRSDGHCNALLESPTGSGKSLALLCATLAWQQHYKVLLNSNKSFPTSETENDVLVAGGGFIPDKPTPGSKPEDTIGSASIQKKPGNARQAEIKPKVPRIYYATRTHTQIAQVIREFRKTKYRVPMAVLASKKHYCTNKQVVKKKNVDEDCLILLRESEQGGCPNFRNMQKVKGHASIQRGAVNDIHDIEDLVKIGHSVKGCAYFAARAMAMEAEIVFCPYSYIIDPIIREAMEVNIQGSIIILDEAHNIEDVAREAGSIDLEETVLDDMRVELEHICSFETTAEYYQPLLVMIQELLAWTGCQVKKLTKLEFEHHSSCWTGDKALQELRAAGFPLESFEVLLSCCRKAVAAAAADKGIHLSGRLVKPLERLFRVLQFMLSNNARRAVDYQLVVRKYMRRDEALVAGGWVVTASLWCLNPAVVFEEISTMSQSIIVTSGTLAPVDSFASELGVLFDVRIEAPHVVDMGTQVWATALSVGPRDVVLNASYKNAENFVFQDAVGAALLEIFKVTPDGVLIFFPSYKLLKKLCNRWQSTGDWVLLADHKQLFIEPRVNDEIFESVLQGYYGSINGTLPAAPKKSKRRTKKTVNDQWHTSVGKAQTNGAAFLAVCRGKVSEGIDFTDKYARAVVVVGIPFPNVKDIQVSLKKQYNSTHQVTKKLLSGDQWYCQQAFRALNQAVGRCIRHRYDYGGIILLDERFKITRNMEYMSKWLRKSIRQSDNFQASMGQLQDFFSRLKESDLRATAGTPEPALVKKLPEFPISGHMRLSSPITPVPITPLKSESGLLRVSNKLELCITSKSLTNLPIEEVSKSPCLRSGLLTQFNETETESTPRFCFGDICAQPEASSTCKSDLGLQLVTKSCDLQGTLTPAVKTNAESENTRNFFMGMVPADICQAQGAAETVYCSRESGQSAHDEENTTINITDDDGVLYSSMEILNVDGELLCTSVNTRSKQMSICSLENSVFRTGLSGLRKSCVQNPTTVVSPLGVQNDSLSSSYPADPNCLESTGGIHTVCTITQPENCSTQANIPCHSPMFCGRCGLGFGVINNLEIMTLQKSYFTSLLDHNKSQSGRASRFTPVYFTDLSLISSGLTEEREPELGSVKDSGVHKFDNNRRQESGLWVEEDGCVFKPLVCSSCIVFYVGAHIIAADSNNMALIGKVAIFVESISFEIKGKLPEGIVDYLPDENICCQQPVSSTPICSQLKRAQTTQLGKRKLKLPRRSR